MRLFRFLNIMALFFVVILAGATDWVAAPWWFTRVQRYVQFLNYDLYSYWFPKKLEAAGPQLAPTQTSVILVDIDEKSLTHLPEFGRWPWRRDFQAYLINEILKYEPKKLIIDIIYSEKERSVFPEGLIKELSAHRLDNLIEKYQEDNELIKVLLANKKKIIMTLPAPGICRGGDCDENLSADASDGKKADPYLKKNFKNQLTVFASRPEMNDTIPTLVAPVTPLPEISAVTKNIGLSLVEPEFDGLVRQQIVWAQWQNFLLPSMAMLVSPESASLSLEPIQFLRFYQAQSFRHLSAVDFIKPSSPAPSSQSRIPPRVPAAAEERNEANPLSLIKDQVVVLGVSATSLGDIHNTPLGLIAGPEIVATSVTNFLRGDILKPLSARQMFAFWILVFLIFGLYFFWLPQWRGTPFYFAFGTIGFSLLVLDWWAFQNNQLTPLVFPFLQNAILGSSLVVFRFLDEENRRDFIKKAFSSYISPQLVDQMIKDPSLLRLGGQKKKITILFSDIRGFTTFSEKMDPMALSQLLNEYLTAMTDTIFESQGTLDKYIGDAVMAFWGAPVEIQSAEAKALTSAIKMMNWVEEHRLAIQERFQVQLQIGIGLNTGVVSVGNMGSSKSLGYTVIGDDVNLASRLEGATKYYEVEILTTESTVNSLSETEKKQFQFKRLDYLTVKGRSHPVRIYQVLYKTLPEDLRALFEEAMECYLKQDWEGAQRGFHDYTQKHFEQLERKDPLAEVFLSRIAYFQTSPPPADWDGSWKMESK